MFKFSKHSIERLLERQITIDIAEQVLEHPEEIIENNDGLTVYQAIKLFENGKNYLVRIYVHKKVEPQIVVTAIRTTKFKKYKQ